jgi:hypothetical protein
VKPSSKPVVPLKTSRVAPGDQEGSASPLMPRSCSVNDGSSRYGDPSARTILMPAYVLMASSAPSGDQEGWPTADVPQEPQGWAQPARTAGRPPWRPDTTIALPIPPALA